MFGCEVTLPGSQVPTGTNIWIVLIVVVVSRTILVPTMMFKAFDVQGLIVTLIEIKDFKNAD